MTTNAQPLISSPSIAADHRLPPRGVTRWKAGSNVVPLRQPAATVPKLELQEVSLSYKTESGERLLALDRIDLQVRQGEFLCLVGPSGCGKSTLLHLIAGLHQPTSGSVLVDERPVTAPGTDRILIFQEHGLFPWLTVGENVEFGMKMKGLPKAERAEKTEKYLRLVHLTQFKKSRPHQLSGGCGNGLRWPGPWPPSRMSSLWTSRSPHSMPKPATCFTMNWNASGRKPDERFFSSHITCVRRFASAIAWFS